MSEWYPEGLQYGASWPLGVRQYPCVGQTLVMLAALPPFSLSLSLSTCMRWGAQHTYLLIITLKGVLTGYRPQGVRYGFRLSGNMGCMYIHAYIRIYIHTYIHTYVRTYMHTYIHTYIHTWDMYADMHCISYLIIYSILQGCGVYPLRLSTSFRTELVAVLHTIELRLHTSFRAEYHDS